MVDEMEKTHQSFADLIKIYLREWLKHDREEIDFIDGSISADWRSVKTRMMLIFHNCFYKPWQDFAAIVPETPRSAQWG